VLDHAPQGGPIATTRLHQDDPDSSKYEAQEGVIDQAAPSGEGHMPVVHSDGHEGDIKERLMVANQDHRALAGHILMPDDLAPPKK
jgi:hypothetical protein